MNKINEYEEGLEAISRFFVRVLVLPTALMGIVSNYISSLTKLLDLSPTLY